MGYFLSPFLNTGTTLAVHQSSGSCLTKIEVGGRSYSDSS